MEIRRNDPRDFRAFADLNIAWIKELHHVEASDQKMYDHPEIYAQNGNSIFSAVIDGEVAGVVVAVVAALVESHGFFFFSRYFSLRGS